MRNPVTDEFVAELARRLSSGALRRVESRYLEEPRNRFRGRAGAVVAPASTAEVAEVVRVCADARVGIVPYGGGTGLVAGQVMTGGPLPLVLSLERMTAIRGVWPEENTLVAEAGAIVEEVQRAAEEAGRLFPLSYGADGSARIGGALAVNSGGINVVRYGVARELCLGIEAVLPDGQILHGLKRLLKDNTGYDIRDLLIGSEGTLGIITAASLRLHARPARVGTALLVVPGPAEALRLLARTQEAVGEGVTAFELMSGAGLGFLDEVGAGLRQPFDPIPDWVVLVELGLPRRLDPDAVLEEVFAAVSEAGEALDGVIARSGQHAAEFWALRDGIPEANRKIGAVASHDISLPLSAIPEFVQRCDEAILALGPVRINAFGHLGDGNLHYNVFPARGVAGPELDHLRAAVSETVHDLVNDMDGSFSAEHGVGRLKVGEMARYCDPARLDLMRRIKAVMDPLGIMNPGAVLPGDGGG